MKPPHRESLIALAGVLLPGCSLLFGWSDLKNDGARLDGGAGDSDASSDAGASVDADADAAAPNGIRCTSFACVGDERCCFSHVQGRLVCATEARCPANEGDYFFPCTLPSHCDGGAMCCTTGASSRCASTCASGAGESSVCDPDDYSRGLMPCPTGMTCQANTPTYVYSCR